MRNLDLLLVCIILAAMVFLFAPANESPECDCGSIAQEINARSHEIKALREEYEHLRLEHEKLREAVEAWLEVWEVETWEATSYAPLCDDAIPGWDYWGDPSVTASGATVEVGRTVAAGPDVPFGTLIYVVGHGWREVQDRGSAIGPGKIDIAVDTKAEAQQFGRQDVVVAYKKGE